jgi:hypothetical protein
MSSVALMTHIKLSHVVSPTTLKYTRVVTLMALATIRSTTTSFRRFFPSDRISNFLIEFSLTFQYSISSLSNLDKVFLSKIGTYTNWLRLQIVDPDRKSELFFNRSFSVQININDIAIMLLVITV